MEDTSVSLISGEMFSHSPLKYPKVCSIGFKPGHSFHFFSSLETLASFRQCALAHDHAGIFLFCQASGDCESSCQTVFGISTGIHGAIYKYHHTPTSVLHCQDYAFSGSPGQVYAKPAGPHLRLTHLSWSHLAKERSPNIHQPSLRVL